MTATDLIDECRKRGVELTAAPGRLRVRAPGRLDPLLAERLKAQKDPILAALTARCGECGGPVNERRQCWKCLTRCCSGCGQMHGVFFCDLCMACGNNHPDH